jgi:metal-responsive CopG/Arc/MetJ family transcriptional regulator
MTRTRIQLPDHLYLEAKRIAQEYEMSISELIRRALELAIPGYPPRAREPSGSHQ